MTAAASPLEAVITAVAEASEGAVGALGALTGPIAEWLRRQPVGVLRSLDRRFRDRGVLARLGLSPMDAWTVEHLEALPHDEALVVQVLCSLQRDGYARQAAVVGLAALPVDRWSLAALVNRVADPVPAVATEAVRVLQGQLGRAAAHQLVSVLPMVDAVRSSRRARDAPILATVEALVAEAPAALRAGQASAREDVRLACLRRRLKSTEALPALRLALVDPGPSVRRVARDAVARMPRDVQEALVDVMEASRSPDIRLVALRQRRREHDVHAVRTACFDPSVDVRFYARRYHRALGGGDLRPDALAVCASASGAGPLVGALALLSDVGTRADVQAVRPFLSDPRGRVAREAARTLALLEGG
ncbi:MAG: hypothetical protein KTR31_09380 [Myxococcales bacterium]|nr:hypothetical protein [Myxococcales bacterium]